MINFFTNYFKYISRTLFTVLPIVLIFNPSITFAQQELSAFSYVNANTSKNSNESNAVSSAQADSANITQQDGVETWHIALNEQVSNLTKGDSLQIPLPSGQVVNATINTRKLFKNGDVQLLASNGSGVRIILTVGSDAAFGSIVNNSEGVNFSISLDRNASQILIDQDTLPVDAVDFTDDFIEVDSDHGLSPQTLETSVHSEETTATETDGRTNIDVLFVHSEEFNTLFGSAETRVNQLMGFTNQAYEDTGILINLRAVGVVELDIDDTATVGTLLTDVRNNALGIINGTTPDSGFENIAELRDQAGADLVAVLTTNASNFSSNGIAFIGGNRQDLGFSSTTLGLFCCDIVFAHEIGHNLGSGHQREELLLPVNEGISPCTGGFTGFSCGHSVNENGSTNWSTIMASGRSINRMNIFSNLTLDCDGDPCGIAQGEEGAADNLTSFNFTRIAISQFRDEVVPEPESDDGFLLDIIPSIIRSTQ